MLDLGAVTGAASVAVVVLAYVLLVEGLTALVVLLSEFIVLRIRVLLALVASKPPAPEPAPTEPQGQTYQLGGDLKW